MYVCVYTLSQCVAIRIYVHDRSATCGDIEMACLVWIGTYKQLGNGTAQYSEGVIIIIVLYVYSSCMYTT